MLRKISFAILILLCINSFGQEQETTLTLEESIQLALQNNLELQNSILDSKRARINKRQSVANVFPDLNGNYNIGISNGRSINPFTNAYINQELTFSNASLALDAVVFNGFGLINSIRQANLNLKASKMEVEEAKQNLILDVTLAYLQVLNNRDLVELAQNRLETTTEQVTRLKVLYDQEVGNPADYTDIVGQSANDRTSLVQAENNVQDALSNLIQLLNTDLNISLDDVEVLIEFEKYPFTAEEVFQEALENLATFKARELRIEAAEKGVYVARAAYFPEISLFAQLNTNYSSAAEIFLETGTNVVETGGFVTVGDEVVPVFSNQPQFAGEQISYNDQFENNLNSVVGLSVSVPILNGLQARNNVALQKINLEESELALASTKLELEQAIIQAHNDMESAYQRYQILLEQLEAFEESFRINEIRFNNGVSNIVEYTISKNNLDNARINLANAKYEYLLRVKVLDYFRGGIQDLVGQ